MEEFKWELPKIKNRPIEDNDLRIVNLPVEVVFEWSDKIIAEYDSETDTVLEYKSGYIMRVIPDQSFIYNNQESTFVARVFKQSSNNKQINYEKSIFFKNFFRRREKM